MRKVLACMLALLILVLPACTQPGDVSGPNDSSVVGDTTGAGTAGTTGSQTTGTTGAGTPTTQGGTQGGGNATTAGTVGSQGTTSRPTSAVTPADPPKSFMDSNKEGVLKDLTNLNYIDDTTPLPNVKPVADKDKKARVPGQPYVVDVKYDDGMGLVVALYNVVEDYKACNDGSKSAAGAIQQALNAAKKAGGGVVYIPEGVYLLDKSLDIPSGVTLRGEWVSPEKAKPGSCGTVILATGNRGRETGQALFRLNVGAGVRNMTVLYPDQKAGDIAKYPPTIQEVPGGDSYSAVNMTIAGAWNGYNGASGWSELHFLKNVYITAFNRAVMLDNVTDIGRMENVHMNPSYFVDNAYKKLSDADKATIREYMFQKSTGMYFIRSDWEYVYNVSVEGLSCGMISLQNSEGRSLNAQLMKVTFKNCKVAINMEYTNAIGIAFTDILIEGDSRCEAGVRTGEKFTYNAQFENLRISGPIKEQISYNGSGRIMITNGVFAGWDSANSYAINMHRGGLSLQQCTFKEKAKHITATSRCGGISVLGCTFPGAKDINCPAREKFTLIDDTKLNLPVTNGLEHTYRQSIPQPSSKYLYNVVDFGAVKKQDCTEAFKKALEAARKTGGIVYVPAGEWTVSQPLVVPTGVELRGIYDVPTHPKTAGSIICTTWGKNDENAEPFVKLEESSGINGISFAYSEQSYTKFIPYSWTVQSQGKNCWAINSVFINSYNALDFGTNPSDGHYVQYVSGSPIRRGVFVGNNASNGWVENVQFNPHYWKRSALSSKPATGETEFNYTLNTSLDAFIVGDCASEHMLGNFVYASKNAIMFIKQTGKGANALIIGHGSDGCRHAMVVEQADTVVMLNSELVSMDAVGEKHHVWLQKTCTGTVGLINTMSWSHPTSSLRVENGTLIMGLSSYHNMEKSQYMVNATGGHTYLTTVLMIPKDTQVLVAGGKVEIKGFLLKQSLSFAAPSGGASVKVKKTGGTFSERFSWWA